MIVDAHIHVREDKHCSKEWIDALLAGRKNLPIDKTSLEKIMPISQEEWLNELKEAGIDKAVVLAADHTRMWKTKVPDEYVAEFVSKDPDMLVGYSSVEPLDEAGRFKKGALDEVERAVNEYGFKGLKLLPSYGNYYANDKVAYPLYHKCLELGIPVLFHISITKVPKSPIKYSDPRLLSDVASDFPDLKIGIAHLGGRGWAEMCLALLSKHENMYADISGAMAYSPTWITWNLVLAKEFRVLDRVMFGTDGPGIGRPPKRYVNWCRTKLNETAKRSGWPTFTEEEINGILGNNAVRILKL